VKKPIVIIGIGEMGGVFARGFLRSGYPVFPVTRQMSLEEAAGKLTDPELVLLAVAENDLHHNLSIIPPVWRNKLVLLQNELLPGDWQQYSYTDPTVISVWFEKKKGQDAKVLIPSPAYGPHADLLKTALGNLGIPVRVLHNEAELLFELVRKNVYILTTNIAGLKTGGTVSELWSQHRELANNVASEVIQLQQKLAGRTLEPEPLIAGMIEAFEGDPEHKCMGRSAPARLQRALQLACDYQLSLPVMESLQELS
jgi:ketopantoate reductase